MADHETRSAVLVLGAAGGIGSALARLLASRGYRLLLAGRSAKNLTVVAHEIDAPHYEVDATDITAVETCLTDARNQFGDLHGVVNCVGSILL